MSLVALLIILLVFVFILLLIASRIYNINTKKERKTKRSIDDFDEVERRETFRQMVYNFISKY